ncbi:class I SAM-dependent methyltransferase, partial [bacterium]|nr:class I SAM-dependent methyltransferase [bacterium]
MKRVPENGAMDDPREVESYDQLSRQHLGLVERKFIQRLLSLLKSKRRPLVLDVGAGPGNIPLELARRREDARLVAVDLSSGMLRLAREKFRGQGLTGQFRV